MPRLSHNDRNSICILREEGWTVQALAERFGVNRRTIMRLEQKVRQTGSIEDRPRAGRPVVMTPRQNRILRRMSTEDRHQVSRTLRQRLQQEHNIRVSQRTVARRLLQMGLRGCISKRKPLLTQRHKGRRLEWARNHQDWTVEQWRNVLFSDETPLHLVQNRQRRYVRRQVGQAHAAECIRPTVHGGGGRMVWGAFDGHGTLILHTVEGTLNSERYVEILRGHLLPLNRERRDLLFQQDNATPHVSRRTLAFLQENHVSVLPWPPQSPDLNPIEHLWGHLKQQLEGLRIQTTAELLAAAHHLWRNLSPEVVTNLIRSMPERVQAVIRARGGHTRY